MASEVRYSGQPASPGLAIGVVVVSDRIAAMARDVGSPDEEIAALKAAVASAAAAIGDLITRVEDTNPEGAAILEFQFAMLEDDALIEPAIARIANGSAADVAFAEVMDEMAADYEASGDDYFAARASDLRDLKERVVRALSGDDEDVLELPDNGVLIADDLTPSAFLSIQWRNGQAIALSTGSPTAHVAILARARDIPMAVGLGPIKAADGETAILDGEAGTLTLDPDAQTARRSRDRLAEQSRQSAADANQLAEPAITADGEPVEVHINIAGPAELDEIDPTICDGVGLVRTEFLFSNRDGLPDEDEQAAAYERILIWAKGKPVTIRTLDAGGDKPIAGYTLDGEGNPFLGLRGIRLSLARHAVFETQLRALVRAAPVGSLRIMVPMVSIPDEMTTVNRLVDGLVSDEGSRPAVGMMVEVPSAALTLERFTTDFVSIGSNDLTQYVMAASRDSSDVAALQDAADPAVLKLIAMTVDAAKRMGIPVSLCGDAAADPRVLPALLATGLRSISVVPSAVGRVKRIIRSWSAAQFRTEA